MNALPLLVKLSDRLWDQWMTDHNEATYNLLMMTEKQITNLLNGSDVIRSHA